MLEGIRVVEIGDGIAGAACCAILAGLNAEVTKWVWSDADAPAFEPALSTPSGARVSLLRTLLDRDKSIRTGGAGLLSGPLFPEADIVVHDRVDAADAGASDGHGPRVEGRPPGVWVSLTPFGLDGPYARYRGGELIAAASGGLAATIAPKGGGRPSLLPGWQGLLTTGQVGALAALHGLDRSRRTHRSVHVEVSAQEAVAMTSALPECAHALYACPGQAGSGRYIAPSGLFACRDGHVRITAPDNHQWAGVVRAMGSPAWTVGLEERPARAERAREINAEIERWTRSQAKAECAERLQGEGVPSTPVNGPDDLFASPQFENRRFLRTVDLAGVETRVPGPAYTWTPSGAEGASGSDGAGLDGLRVAEFAHVLSGPIAGALLGAMGAHVVRFEDRARLDLYRRTGPFARGVAGPERGAYFAVANHSKHSLAVDVEAEPEAGRRLVGSCDVVLENFGAKRMARLGLDPERALSERPELLYLSLSGFGQSGPLASWRAYANTVHAYGGLAHLTRDAAGQPIHITTVIADPLASLTAATVIVAWSLSERRRGGVIDLSMAEVVAGRLAEFIAAVGLGQSPGSTGGCDRFPYSPHGIFEAADGRWLAIAVQDDSEWQALLDALERPRSLCDPAWSSATARWEARRAIGAVLEAITRERDAEELFHRLQRGGVRACPVWSGADLVHDEHLAARNFFPEIDPPEPDLRPARLVGLAWRFAGGGAIPLRPPPRLGSYLLPERAE